MAEDKTKAETYSERVELKDDVMEEDRRRAGMEKWESVKVRKNEGR